MRNPRRVNLAAALTAIVVVYGSIVLVELFQRYAAPFLRGHLA